ncbi:MAG: FAD-dependent oxidoreductase [Candidatus Thorarchaeota archaeon]
MSTHPVLVIGAGVAGLTAAVELADSGVQTVLIERNATVGGNALDLYKAFPTDDCFYCFEGNRWRPGIRKCFYRSALLDQPNLTLKINTTIKEVTGEPGKFRVVLSTGPTYVDPKKCIMCGKCMEHSKAFLLISPQCQPQAVIYNPDKADDDVARAVEECPTKAIDLDAQPSEETINVSDIIVATGYHEMQPVNVDEYGYGRIPNVVTQLELARMLDPNGITGGVLTRPSDGEPVKSVIMIQCVGSRDEKYYPYCSKICCIFALKHANIIALERENVSVNIVYMDIRTYDRYERYYREAREAGVNFIRGRVQRVRPNETGGIEAIVYDSLLDKYLKFNTDLFVLSSALEAPKGSEELIKALGLRESNGFVAPANLEMEDNVVVGDHVYACGTALGPAEVPESVTQARAVVSKILQSRK